MEDEFVREQSPLLDIEIEENARFSSRRDYETEHRSSRDRALAFIQKHGRKLLLSPAILLSIYLLFLRRDKYGMTVFRRLFLHTVLLWTRFLGGYFRLSSALHTAYDTDTEARLFVVTMDYRQEVLPSFHQASPLSEVQEENRQVSAMVAGSRTAFARMHGYLTGDCARPHSMSSALHEAGVASDFNFAFVYDQSKGNLNKLRCLIATMEPLLKTDVKWIQWVDTDIVFADPSIDMRQYLPSAEAERKAGVYKHMVISADRHGFNLGVGFYKVSESTLSFLRQWLKLGLTERFVHMRRDQPPLASMWNKALSEENRRKCAAVEGDRCLKDETNCTCVPLNRRNKDASLKGSLRFVEMSDKGVELSTDADRLPGIQVVPQFWFNSYVDFRVFDEDMHAR
ncbi:MAG: hypothetical protein MHM6MM_004615 [Cercozoa sp. M6MM]